MSKAFYFAVVVFLSDASSPTYMRSWVPRSSWQEAQLTQR